jgi:hypothetical protein
MHSCIDHGPVDLHCLEQHFMVLIKILHLWIKFYTFSNFDNSNIRSVVPHIPEYGRVFIMNTEY